MFSKSKRENANTELETKEKSYPPSILSKNLHITGNLETEGDIHVEGVIDGDVKSQLVTVGAAAVVNGSITGDTVQVDGTVNGQINGRTVQLGNTAKVTGDIVHESLAIDAGAFVHGMCRNVGQDQQRPDLFAAKPSLVVAGDDEESVVAQ